MADDLRFFTVLASSSSLSEAANRLGVTPAAVSRHLRSLEERLGTVLVARNSRRMTLTEAGHRYQAGCADLLGRLEELEENVGGRNDHPHGLIRINASYGFGRAVVAPAAAVFSERYPDVAVSLLLTDAALDLVAEKCDLGIHVGELRENRYHARRLFINRRYLAASPGYLEEAGVPHSPAELSEFRTIDIAEDGSSAGVWQLMHGTHRQRVKVRPLLTTNSSEVATDWAAAGRGIVLRSRWALTPYLESGALRIILPEWTMPSDAFAVYAVKQLSTGARFFLDFFASYVKERGLS